VWYHRWDFCEEEKERSEETLKLLQAIKQKYGINFEEIKKFDDEEIYNDVFLKNRNKLSKNTGISIRRLRSRGGRGTAHVDGVICVFEKENPIYFAPSLKRNEFLKGILENGPAYIEQKVKENRSKEIKKEKELIEDFLHKAKDFGFTGTLEENVGIGGETLEIKSKEKSEKYQKFAKRFYSISQKEIDILHEKPDGSCDIIEVKDKLNWEAIGQVIGYRILLAKERNISKEKIGMCVVCRWADEALKKVCEELNIRVITISEE
jgi:hypothetical protein